MKFLPYSKLDDGFRGSVAIKARRKTIPAASAGNTDTASLLAKAAQQAGLTQTKASNATGLDTSATVAGNYGSAREVAWHMKPAK